MIIIITIITTIIAIDVISEYIYQTPTVSRHAPLYCPFPGPQAPSAGDSRTEWERQQEQEEFSRAAALYQPMSGLMASRFVRAKQEDADDTVEVPAETGVCYK